MATRRNYGIAKRSSMPSCFSNLFKSLQKTGGAEHGAELMHAFQMSVKTGGA